MDSKAAEQAVLWARKIVAANDNKLPSWGEYKSKVRAALRQSQTKSFEVPAEYQYAYLRVKGCNHFEALDRMQLLPSENAARGAPPQRKRWSLW